MKNAAFRFGAAFFFRALSDGTENVGGKVLFYLFWTKKAAKLENKF